MFKQMDKINESNQHYQYIYTTSVAVFIIFTEIYLNFDLQNIDLLAALGVQNNIFRIIISVAVQPFLFYFIYIIVQFIFKSTWIHKNKNIWVKGVWLHIHIKNEVRLGIVTIQQDFTQIQAVGENVSPKSGTDPVRKGTTSWNYLLSKVIADTTLQDFVGCYQANENLTNTHKNGVHTLEIRNFDRKTGYPNYMQGFFRDTFTATQSRIIDVHSHVGRLYLYKLPQKIEAYIYDDNGINYDALSIIHTNEDLKNEPFCIKLKECLAEAAAIAAQSKEALQE